MGWVPGHEVILGNDELCKMGADTPFTRPETILGLPYCVVKRATREWMDRKHMSAGSLEKTASIPSPSGKDLNKKGLLNC